MTTPLPPRLQPARRFQVDHAMPGDWQQAAGLQLHELRRHLVLNSDPDISPFIGWTLHDIDTLAADLVRPLRARLLGLVDEATKACGVDLRSPVTRATFVASLMHHGGREDWLTIRGENDPPELWWELTLHSDPKLFRGGEAEWLDGTAIAPDAGRLVLWDPRQARRIAPVECWSAHVLHGRWSIGGLVG